MANLKRIIEALLFATSKPLSLKALSELLPEWTMEELKKAISELIEEWKRFNLSFGLQEVGEGYQFRTFPEYSIWIRRLKKVLPIKLSQAALETLAIVAWKQPISRGEIEEIRGVDSGHVLGVLLEKGLIKPVGRKEAPGRPLLYGTSEKFLELFGLRSLKDLPSLKELETL